MKTATDQSGIFSAPRRPKEQKNWLQGRQRLMRSFEFCSVACKGGRLHSARTFGYRHWAIHAEGTLKKSCQLFFMHWCYAQQSVEQLQALKQAGIQRLVACAATCPAAMACVNLPTPAIWCVSSASIRATPSHIEVAGYPEMHPQARSMQADLRALKAMADAGANGVFTQYFFNADAYFRFVEDAERLGVTIPIVPHHAHCQQQPVDSFLGCLRGRSSALAASAIAGAGG